MINSEHFFQYLRSALNHLYDPNFLRKSPLVKVFGMDDQPDTSSALQRILNDAISALEPSPDECNLKQKMRNYELIMYRYVQQFDQEEVANQLGLSVRHLRREQNGAIYELAAFLWEKYQLGARPFQMIPEETEDSVIGQEDDSQFAVSETESSTNSTDWDWLKEIPLEDPASLEFILSDVIELSRSLAARYDVSMNVHWLSSVPGLAIQKVALRQILINILSALIVRQVSSQLSVSIQVEGKSCLISIQSQLLDSNLERLSDDARTNLDIARRLAVLSHGEMQIEETNSEYIVRVKIPIFQQKLVLVVDDNVDFIQLIERSVTGTRYQVIGERDPLLALTAAEKNAPDIIFLDVMMPKLDGWEMLSWLRQNPQTQNIPVVMCSIVPQREFALSLGAREFLRKPVTQSQVLSALDRLAASQEPESH